MSLRPLPGEKEILAGIAAGDKQAFTLLFNHYQQFVFSFGKRLTRSEELAFDMVQDVFLKLWKSREALAEVDVFGAYLNRVVRNQALNVLRGMTKHIQSGTEINEGNEISEETTLHHIDYHEIVRIVNDVVSKLSPQQKMAYELCHQQGLKYEEAAERMQISPKTVHAHMKYALARIREHLKKHSVHYPVLILLLLKNISE